MPVFIRSLTILVALGSMSACGLIPLYSAESQEPARVVVLGVQGAAGPALRNKVVATLDSKVELVPARSYWKTAAKIKARGLRPSSIKRVAAELGLDAVVQGRVRKRGKRRVLELRIRSGADGLVAATVTTPVAARRRIRPVHQADFRTQLYAAVDDTRGSRAPDVKAESADDMEFEVDDVRDNKNQKVAAKSEKKPAKVAKKSEKKKPAKVAKKSKKKPAKVAKKSEKKKPAKVAKKSKKKKKDDEIEDSPSLHAKYDGRGQAIDDEVPDVLR